MAHKSVLLKETIDCLALEEGDVYLDATLGSGGHLEEVSRRTKGTVELLGIDTDQMSLAIAKENLDLSGVRYKAVELNFRNIEKAPELLDAKQPSKIVFDLGWSSPQFEEGARGFSFQKEEPLIMSLKSNLSEEDITAHDVVNTWSEENLATVIYGYGEEKYSRRIAKAIVEARANKPIETSLELAEIIKRAVPVFYRFGRIHPATKTFQAIRIAVNDELRALEEGLRGAFTILRKGGRVAVISFHSLEDRIVKNFFREKVESGEAEYIEDFGKKPMTPSEQEIAENPRSRSAKLRVIRKI